MKKLFALLAAMLLASPTSAQTTAYPIISGSGSSCTALNFCPSISTPNTSSFSWINQGSCTSSNTTTGMLISSTSSASGICQYVLNPPGSTPYTIKVFVAGIYLGSSTGGIVVTGNTVNRYITWANQPNGSSPLWQACEYILTTLSTCPFSQGGTSVGNNGVWLEAVNNGTTIAFGWSADGVNFVTPYSYTISAGFLGTISQIGVYLNPNGTYPEESTFISWFAG